MKLSLMRYGLLLITFTVLLVGCAAPTLKSAGGQTNVRPAMWHVQSGNSDVYLFGSFHSLPPGVKWYGDTIAGAFDAAHELVVESIETPEEAVRAMQLIESRALLPDGKTLDDYLDDETFAKLMASADRLNLNRWRVARTQPWFLSIMFAYEGMSQNGIHKEYGVDNLFEKSAVKRGMKVSGLETMSEAIDSLAKQPLNAQIKQLKVKLNSEEDARISPLAQLFEAWAFGDDEGLARLMRKEMTRDEYQRVLVTRNRRWLPIVEQHIATPEVEMIVVGAAHLAGRQSLIEMLRNRGYRVSRVQ